MSHQSRRHEYKHLLSRLCLIKREKFSGDDDLTRLCVPFEMDLHPAKRRRLDKDPGSWAKQTEDQIEEPHIQLPRSPFYQASSHPHLTSFATLQDSLALEYFGLPARLCLNRVSSTPRRHSRWAGVTRAVSNAQGAEKVLQVAAG